MISVKNLYKPKPKYMANIFLKKNTEKNISQIEKISDNADIYGCDIKIKSSAGESEWMTINEDQVKELIQTYKKKLND